MRLRQNLGINERGIRIMSKELEALERIALGSNTLESQTLKFQKDYMLVENALKQYEMEHTLRIRLENINYELVREKQENEKKLKVLDIIKSFANYQIVEVQGQWYLIQGVSFDKSLKLPITEKQAILLKEVLL